MESPITFVKTTSELSRNLTEFNHLSYGHRKDVMHTSPVYFVHEKQRGVDRFCVAKACAVKGFRYTEYIQHRRAFDGAYTQKRISFITERNWVGFDQAKTPVKKAFLKWIAPIFPHYDVTKAYFISLNDVSSKQAKREKGRMSAKDLHEKLKLQQLVGEIGEEIAVASEIARLKTARVKEPEECVEHLSSEFINAGFDIKSLDPTNGLPIFIEVKSSTQSDFSSFHISRNEVEVLREKGNQGFIYLIHVTDIPGRKGSVINRIKNPISKLKLTAEQYQARLK